MRVGGLAGRTASAVVTVLALIALTLAVPGPADAETPPLLNWGEILPGFTPGIDTSDANVCKSGRPQCVQSVLRTMSRDFHHLARTCDHNAIFQLGYLRTTEAYYESSQIPGFYADVAWMHHYDAVFAEFYLSPQRAWQRGRHDDVPPAWRTAFAAADGQEITAQGNFLLGMNAHINRDLPFVLDDIGLTAADGTSRKPDHERVNEFLNHVGDDLSPEMAARFDPAWDTNPDDDLLAGFAVQQMIQEWRERAWNNAWLMTYAPPLVGDLVAQGIEAGAAQLAVLLRQALVADDAATQARNAYCAVNWDSWAGGDGTFFDDEDEPLYDAASIDLPNPEADLQALAALGVDVDVSLQTGITITVGPALMTTPSVDLLAGVVDPVVGVLGRSGLP